MPSPESSESDYLFKTIAASLHHAALATIAHEIRGRYEATQEIPPEIFALLRKLDQPNDHSS